MFSLRTGAKKNQSIFTILCHFFDAFWYYFLYVQQACRKRGGLGALGPQFLAKQLTLSQPGGTNYAHHSTMSPSRFSDLATGLYETGRVHEMN